MSLPQYAEYRHIGSDWFCNLPAHWGVKRVKHLLPDAADSMRIGPFGSALTSDMLVPDGFKVYGQENVIAGDFKRGERYISAQKRAELSAYSVLPGDVLVTMMGTSGRCAIVPSEAVPGVMDSHLLRIRLSTEIHPPFFQCLIDRAEYVARQVSVLGKGSIMHGLNSGIVRQLLLAIPPYAEQLAITAFLDSETAKIDALIAEQEKLIALLAEKHQATISHAVTRGLNPNAPMKDSGVPWLGEVPAHWRVGKAGFYVTVLPGYAFPSTGFSQDEGDIRLLRGINVAVGELRWDEVVFWKRLEGDGLDAFELEAGDVVIGMDRPLISSGMRVATVTANDLPCLLLQRVAKIHPGPDIDGRFIMRLLGSRAFEAHFTPETTGVSVPHISGEQITNFVIPIPPIDEQSQLCQFLENELSRLASLQAEARRAVDLLQERRSALIAAAVTGQIDVRVLVPQDLAPA